MAMKTEPHHGLPPAEEFGADHWVEIAGESPHHSPLHDFNGFGYISPSHLPQDSPHNRSYQNSYFVPHPLHPLNIPQWPSQLTNPSEHSPPVPIPAPSVRPIAPATSIPTLQPARAASVTPAPDPKPHPPQPTARKTLTDNDRRRMCQYHEDNPSVKQTEIGAMFGVERSTVSKVLRQKEKYLSTEDGSRSPVKRSKGKFPDIERALSIWAKNHQKQGLPLNDDIIRDKARYFSTTVGSSECHTKVNSGVWLEKFKQKNSLLGCRPQKVSDSSISDGGLNIESRSNSQTPNGISPISPDQTMPDSPNLKSEGQDAYQDFTSNYRTSHSESVTSFSEHAMTSCFSPDIRSPTSPFFSPDSSCGPSPLIPSQQTRLPPLASAPSRPRRRTFPTISSGNSFVPEIPDSSSSSRFSQSTIATPTLESPIEEMDQSPLGAIDAAIHVSINPTTTTHPHSQQTTPILSPSPCSMAPPPQPPPTILSANNNSSPTAACPPSQDEARRAMETVMAFFEHHQSVSQVDPQEYFVMGKLMEKLKLQNAQLPGGMHGLERGDGTLLGRKRSIHSL
ncbi:MAG: hypothetical protein HETSPECPRED_008753 [Heterodermia speciosa]|uniref:HTH CENPB-type domain-containing protein n=1 Tax=Heterodermia speciosa TaxID=116794 RepID=A0A8H3EKK0_9LECA|nr:MAG: hypothetical protein HETSPECPRED_008753 [Heterodermia speciosa]